MQVCYLILYLHFCLIHALSKQRFKMDSTVVWGPNESGEADTNLLDIKFRRILTTL